jgi:hypothetical protein
MDQPRPPRTDPKRSWRVHGRAGGGGGNMFVILLLLFGVYLAVSLVTMIVQAIVALLPYLIGLGLLAALTLAVIKHYRRPK